MKNETLFHYIFFTVSISVETPDYHNGYKGKMIVSFVPNFSAIDDGKIDNFINKIRIFADLTGAEQMNICSIVDLFYYNIKVDEISVYRKLLINLSKSLIKDLS